MTMRTPLKSHLIQNDSSSTIPPRSIVEVTSIEEMAGDSLTPAATVFHVNKYTGGTGVILVTGETQIPQGAVTGTSPTGWVSGKSFGDAFSDDVIMVAFDPLAASPTAGEIWGPVAGAWTIGRGGTGFKCIGYDASSTLKIAYFRREADSTSDSSGAGCGCNNCFNCVSPEDAQVYGCADAPNGAPTHYTINTGNWTLYPQMTPGGVIDLWYGSPPACGSSSSSSSSSSAGGSGCLWYSCPITVTVDAATAVYQWQGKIFTDSDGYPAFECIPVLLSGTDVLGIAETW